MGLYIALEGPDGCGKSTQIDLLQHCLPGRVISTREPGGNQLGLELRRILKDPEAQKHTPPLARRMLFEADRIAQQAKVYELLYSVDWVISDRICPISNMAYGIAEGSGVEAIKQIEAVDTKRLLPNLVALLEIDRETAWSRQEDGGTDPAEADRSLFDKVCDAYDELIAEARVDRYVFTLSGFRIPAVVIDANGLPHETTKRIACALQGVFPQKFVA